MRYVIRAAYTEKPDSDRYRPWMNDGPMLPGVEVDGPAEFDTGLIDEHGNAIWRMQAPIGFGRDDE